MEAHRYCVGDSHRNIKENINKKLYIQVEKRRFPSQMIKNHNFVVVSAQ